MLNKVFLMGRLVSDPELRHTQNSIAVASFRIAVDRDYKRDDGSRETDFINIVAWRSTAEFVSRYFAKGRMAVVEGKLQVREYTDRDNNRRFATEVVADNVYFGDSKREGDGGGYSQGGYDSGYGAPPPQGGRSGYSNQGGYRNDRGGQGGAPQGRAYGNPPPSTGGGYPSSNYSTDQFTDLTDEDDGELPF